MEHKYLLIGVSAGATLPRLLQVDGPPNEPWNRKSFELDGEQIQIESREVEALGQIQLIGERGGPCAPPRSRWPAESTGHRRSRRGQLLDERRRRRWRREEDAAQVPMFGQ
jgi:hypothetical protein